MSSCGFIFAVCLLITHSLPETTSTQPGCHRSNLYKGRGSTNDDDRWITPCRRWEKRSSWKILLFKRFLMVVRDARALMEKNKDKMIKHKSLCQLISLIISLMVCVFLCVCVWVGVCVWVCVFTCSDITYNTISCQQ